MEDSDARHNKRDMKIDSVLTTQPELGPHIPDGGYGWLVLLATSFFQVKDLICMQPELLSCSLNR